LGEDRRSGRDSWRPAPSGVSIVGPGSSRAPLPYENVRPPLRSSLPSFHFPPVPPCIPQSTETASSFDAFDATSAVLYLARLMVNSEPASALPPPRPLKPLFCLKRPSSAHAAAHSNRWKGPTDALGSSGGSKPPTRRPAGRGRRRASIASNHATGQEAPRPQSEPPPPAPNPHSPHPPAACDLRAHSVPKCWGPDCRMRLVGLGRARRRQALGTAAPARSPSGTNLQERGRPCFTAVQSCRGAHSPPLP
jgi:hypothetical protein